MSEDSKSGRRRIKEDLGHFAEDVNKAVSAVVVTGANAAESIGESLKDTIGDTLKGVRAARDSVVMVRVDKESLARLDDLVESGISSSRSDAAAFLISSGIRDRKGLFEKIDEKIEEIRKAKEELRLLLEQDEKEPEPDRSQ